MTNGICHCVIAISRIFLNDQWKFLPWWLLSKSEYNDNFLSENSRISKMSQKTNMDFSAKIDCFQRVKSFILA